MNGHDFDYVGHPHLPRKSYECRCRELYQISILEVKFKDDCAYVLTTYASQSVSVFDHKIVQFAWTWKCSTSLVRYFSCNYRSEFKDSSLNTIQWLQGSVEQITRSNFTLRNHRTDIQVHAYSSVYIIKWP